MIKDGLLVEPNLDDSESYLNGGTRTNFMDDFSKKIKLVKGATDVLIVKNILVYMHANTKRLNDGSDIRKFKRNSTEILESGERTGCCDSCTLFTSIARSVGIPTMQIVTLSKRWGKRIDKENANGTDGHFFAGIFLKDISGNYNWFLVDPDISNRSIGKDSYVFAYVKDYYDDLGIDSINEMTRVQLSAYRQCDRKDMFGEEKDSER